MKNKRTLPDLPDELNLFVYLSSYLSIEKITSSIENVISYKYILSNQKILLFVSSGRVTPSFLCVLSACPSGFLLWPFFILFAFYFLLPSFILWPFTGPM